MITKTNEKKEFMKKTQKNLTEKEKKILEDFAELISTKIPNVTYDEMRNAYGLMIGILLMNKLSIPQDDKKEDKVVVKGIKKTRRTKK